MKNLSTLHLILSFEIESTKFSEWPCSTNMIQQNCLFEGLTIFFMQHDFRKEFFIEWL